MKNISRISLSMHILLVTLVGFGMMTAPLLAATGRMERVEPIEPVEQNSERQFTAPISTAVNSRAALSITITAPTNGSIVKGSITIIAQVKSIYQTNVTIAVDGKTINSARTNLRFNTRWNTATVSDGSHTISALVRDTSGRTASTSIAVTVKNSSPPPPLPPPPPPLTPPVITSFTATPANITSGQSSLLAWALTGTTTSLSINNSSITGTSAPVSPTATTTYTLMAANSAGTSTAVTIVNVAPAPVIIPPPQPSPNLIQNPSFTATTTSNGGIVPQFWIPVFWGAASGAVFSYPVPGKDDDFATQVGVSTYNATGLGHGSAEWLPNAVPVTPGALYTFSDWYKSDTNSYVNAQWTLSDGSFLTDSVATLGPTGGVWLRNTEVFSAPTNAIALTIVHDIQSVGTLTMDALSLTAGVGQTQTTFNKALVSLTFDDGEMSQYDNAFPILQAAHLLATFYIVTGAITDSIYDFFTDPGQAITAAVTTTSATWSPIYTDPGVQALTFSDTYTAGSPSTIVANYTINSVASSTLIGALPPGTNAHAQFNFTLPKVSGSTVTPISIVHSSAGTMQASNPSMIENVESNMTVPQVKELQAAGHELAAHTVTHSDLTALTPSQVEQEITNSRSKLISWGALPNDGFAYPFGNYNAGVEAQIAGAGYADARTVEIGYNTKSTDKYALKAQGLRDTMPFSDVKSWIDTAIANKLWLIIIFHDIENQSVLTANGLIYGTTPQMLQQIVTYLQQQQAAGYLQVETVHNALSFMP